MDPLSRYYDLETADYTFQDGREVTYRRRRFIPAGASLETLTRVNIAAGDRLDLVTAATLGDPEQFWRVADANDVLQPDELEIAGIRIRIPIPRL